MSYNQDNFSNTGATGDQGKFGGQGQGQNQYDTSDPSYNNSNTNAADRFDSTNNPTGGAHFGASGNPNTFSTSNTGSNTGNTNTGYNQQQPSRAQNYGDDVGSGYQGGAGTQNYADDVGTGGYQATAVNPNSSNPNNTSSTRNPNANSDTMTGVGEGFGAGTGGDRLVNNAGSQGAGAGAGSNAYGNYSSNNAAAGNTFPEGFRGGANDPAYQEGSHYNYKSNQYENDGTQGSGNYDNDNNTGNNNNNNNTSQQSGGKVGLGDKIKGTVQTVQGKITKNPDLVQEGQARKTGNLNNDNNGDFNDDSNFSSGNGNSGSSNFNNANNIDESNNISSANTGRYTGQDEYVEGGNTGGRYGQGNNSSI